MSKLSWNGSYSQQPTRTLPSSQVLIDAISGYEAWVATRLLLLDGTAVDVGQDYDHEYRVGTQHLLSCDSTEYHGEALQRNL